MMVWSFLVEAVNTSNIMVYHQGDDGVDIDEGYAAPLKM